MSTPAANQQSATSDHSYLYNNDNVVVIITVGKCRLSVYHHRYQQSSTTAGRPEDLAWLVASTKRPIKQKQTILRLVVSLVVVVVEVSSIVTDVMIKKVQEKRLS